MGIPGVGRVTRVRYPRGCAHRQRKEQKSPERSGLFRRLSMDSPGHALHQLVHLDHVEQSRRIWSSLQLSADIGPEHFVMALLA